MVPSRVAGPVSPAQRDGRVEVENGSRPRSATTRRRDADDRQTPVDFLRDAKRRLDGMRIQPGSAGNEREKNQGWTNDASEHGRYYRKFDSGS